MRGRPGRCRHKYGPVPRVLPGTRARTPAAMPCCALHLLYNARRRGPVGPNGPLAPHQVTTDPRVSSVHLESGRFFVAAASDAGQLAPDRGISRDGDRPLRFNCSRGLSLNIPTPPRCEVTASAPDERGRREGSPGLPSASTAWKDTGRVDGEETAQHEPRTSDHGSGVAGSVQRFQRRDERSDARGRSSMRRRRGSPARSRLGSRRAHRTLIGRDHWPSVGGPPSSAWAVSASWT